MTDRITCCCGAAVEMASQMNAHFDHFSAEFLKAHATCRDRWTSVTLTTPDNDDTPTLRDRFAMAALTGILAGNSQECGGYASVEDAVQVTFAVADAMMKEREER